MNLLIPILAVVLWLTATAFAFSASLAPAILLITSTALLAYAYTLHRSQFKDDYNSSTWQNGLRSMAPLVLVGLVLALGYGAFALTSPSFMIGGRRLSRK
jgi:uncharacterized membrane protein